MTFTSGSETDTDVDEVMTPFPVKKYSSLKFGSNVFMLVDYVTNVEVGGFFSGIGTSG